MSQQNCVMRQFVHEECKHNDYTLNKNWKTIRCKRLQVYAYTLGKTDEVNSVIIIIRWMGRVKIKQ